LRLDNKRLEITRNYNISCFDSGYHYIPPFIFQYNKDSLSATWETQPLFLHVSRVDIAPADSSDVIFDIKLPGKMPITFSEIFPWIVGAILIGLLVFILVYYFKKRKKQEPLFKIRKPEEPPHIIALRDLDKLKEKKLWQKGKIKLYYSELTGIIRKYIERRYQTGAMEQTSNEIKPLPDENETALLNAYVFVNETKQIWQKELDDQKKGIEGEKGVEGIEGLDGVKGIEGINDGTKQLEN